METMLFFHTQRKTITQPCGKMSRKVRNAFTRTDVIHLRTALRLSAKPEVDDGKPIFKFFKKNDSVTMYVRRIKKEFVN